MAWKMVLTYLHFGTLEFPLIFCKRKHVVKPSRTFAFAQHFSWEVKSATPSEQHLEWDMHMYNYVHIRTYMFSYIDIWNYATFPQLLGWQTSGLQRRCFSFPLFSDKNYLTWQWKIDFLPIIFLLKIGILTCGLDCQRVISSEERNHHFLR